jgi:hypothetical protein
MKILINPADYFERYNGGWTKEITCLDKEKTNGYSLLGEFTQKGTQCYEGGKLYLDCGIGGSRKNNKKIYSLFTITKQGDTCDVEVIKVIGKADGSENYEGNASDWAIKFWTAIEEFFAKSSVVDVQALVKRHKELIAELVELERILDIEHNKVIDLVDDADIADNPDLAKPAPFNEIQYLTL